jgi:hypothetical protein
LKFDFILAREGGWFLTGDHPVLLISATEKNPDIYLIMMPITPPRVSIAYDTRFLLFDVEKKVTPMDESMINYFQIANSEKCVFAPVQTDAATEERIRRHMLAKQKPRGALFGDHWQTSIVGFPEGFQFSFAKRTLVRF